MCEPSLKDTRQAAEWLNIPADTLERLVSARLVPHTRIGKHVRFAQHHLDAIVAAGEEPVQDAVAPAVMRHSPPSGPSTPTPPSGPRPAPRPVLEPVAA
jgi:excisionase family DNA binding protein